MHEDVTVEGMKHHRGRDTFERTSLNELDLPPTTFLGGRAKQDDLASHLRCCGCRSDECSDTARGDQVVTTSVTDLGQGIVLGEHGDAWPFGVSHASPKRRWHAADTALDGESSALEVSRDFTRGFVLFEAELGLRVDGAREPPELASLALDAPIDDRSRAVVNHVADYTYFSMRRSPFIVCFAVGILGCQAHPTPEARQDIAPAASTDAIVMASASASAAWAPPNPPKITAEAAAMGTHLSFAAFANNHADDAAVRRAFDDAIAEIRRIEALMTTWHPSEITRINDAAGKSPVPVSQETYDMVAEALHASAISKGTFDITFESLHGLWKFDEDLDPHPPTETEVKSKLSLVSYHHVKLAAATRTVFLDTVGVRIGLGGIAKGYAVDRAAAILDRAGITSFFVQAGGDLFTRGRKPNGDEWQAGIRDPRGEKEKFFALLPVSDHAFSTAGDYERSYVIDGKRYHHIIDPHTGFPATASRSVTIYAPTALLADEIDDAVFILGPKDGLALVESIDGVGAVIVDATNNLWVSKRLQGKLVITGVPTDAP